ncbi:MAG: NAD(P)/FAD-dependent oxidoreductase [Candidatus Eremiobacteraeota bacterium]|nr:NAD(P)/FAD-dependent oxidoreductase [Candidatus Eremiobacteraeota bacterium]MCW5871206.1 NAD(P)/FAD-dependent oxidoreductase [Candidatus Eremiobacteraeota bacterium]
MKLDYDVIVVGGGHNGLIAAGLLAKYGYHVLVLEKRSQVGGAAVTESPWGPEYKVTSLSYVISLMPPTVLRELELERYGYHVYPQHGYFVPYSDGRYLHMSDHRATRRQRVSQFSAKDALALDRWDDWLSELGRALGPLLLTVPPRLGSHRPADLLELLKFAWKLRGWNTQRVGDVTRLFTMSVADLLEEFFESPQILGLKSVSGIIGTWAGPRSPGTAYVMAHHKIGDLGDGQMGCWGFPRGGMGGATQAMRRAAEAFGCQFMTECEVGRVTTRGGRVTGVALRDGRTFQAPVVITTVHPHIAFLEHLEAGLLPDALVQRLQSWKTRSGTVKINLALDRLPEFRCKPGFDVQVHGGTIVLVDSLDELETAYQEAVAGQPARRPFVDLCLPSVFDDSLAPPGQHIASLFTQWVPHQFVLQPHQAELESYADRIIARLEGLAPGFTRSILHRQIIGPHEMERDYGLIGGNIFHGELSLQQLFHMRPAPGWAQFETPVRGLYNASSATHGGGGVTGIPGLQVARRLLKVPLS